MASYSVVQFHDRATVAATADTVTIVGPDVPAPSGGAAAPTYLSASTSTRRIKQVTVTNLGAGEARIMFGADVAASTITAPTFVQPVVGYLISAGGTITLDASDGAAGTTVIVKAVTADTGRVVIEADVQ